jgi:hypothetical protein
MEIIIVKKPINLIGIPAIKERKLKIKARNPKAKITNIKKLNLYMP